MKIELCMFVSRIAEDPGMLEPAPVLRSRRQDDERGHSVRRQLLRPNSLLRGEGRPEPDAPDRHGRHQIRQVRLAIRQTWVHNTFIHTKLPI